jgi:hypothetical protein
VSNRTAKILISLGCLDLLVAAALHWFGAYPNLASALAASNLNRYLQSGLRAVFLLVAWQWIVFVFVALLATFIPTRPSKALILILSIALFVETALTLKFTGLFLGNELIGSAALLLLLGGLLYRDGQL